MATVTALPLPLLTQKELEEHYRVSPWTVNKWVRDGCPVERLRSGQRRFNLTTVREWHEDGAEAGQRAAAEQSARALQARRTG
jgi:phage terminase Nu1 subunit (DNA packaging protein)